MGTFDPSTFNFHRKRVILDGVFYLRPRRMLKKSLKGCGAVVAPSLKQAARPDLLVQGSTPDGALEYQVRQRGGLVIDEVELAQALGLIDGANELAAALRQVIYEEDFSARAWRRLCYLLEFWPLEDGLLQGVDYARHFADRWPAPLRRSPPRWAVRAANGVAEPRLALCSYVDLGLHLRMTPGRMRNLLEQLPEHVEGLRLIMPGGDQRVAEALLEHPVARGLRYLCLACMDLRGYGVALTRADMPALEELDLSMSGVSTELHSRFLSARNLPRLRAVHMRRWRHLHRWNLFQPEHSAPLLKACDWT
jgi:hypothetical protein